MSRLLAWPVQVLAGCLAVIISARAMAAEPSTAAGAVEHSRAVTFKLTFNNADLVWLGDPASPNALVYPRPGSRPTATDVCAATLSTRQVAPGRRYLREARVAAGSPDRPVYAFTSEREQAIGAVDARGRFVPNEFYRAGRELLPSWPADSTRLKYDRDENALYYEVELPGPVVSESLDFLPWELHDRAGQPVRGTYAIEFVPAVETSPAATAEVALTLQSGAETVVLARAAVPRVLRREQVVLGSFDNRQGTYLPESDYRPGANPPAESEASLTFELPGAWSDALATQGERLTWKTAPAQAAAAELARAKITIDGSFDDWRNVAGVDDPRGDVMPYLEYVPDVDLLELKVANDDEHIYLYARVAGQVGRSLLDKGCSYFYAYMDVDRNAETGFLPTRDDDCYFGVDIGDDCEVQFEFVDSVLRKTFYGFCGRGGDANVLKQQVTLGKSQYGRTDEQGRERADYKAEYILRGGVTEITEDFKLGTSDTIRLAVSPDGREVEIVSSLAGFLKSPEGRPTVQLGQAIDIAVGMECDGKPHRGKRRWGADSTPPIRGYVLQPSAAKAQ